MPKFGYPAEKILEKYLKGIYPPSGQLWHCTASEKQVVQLGLRKLCVNLMLPTALATQTDY